MQQVLDRHITIDQGICHGRPHLAGRRIRVQDIAVWHERLGLSVDEIGADYNLSLAEIYAALSYYFDHKDEIDAAIEADRLLVASHQREQTSLLQTKLSEMHERMRFVGQFTAGYGDYTAERDELFEGMTLDDMIAEIKHKRG